MEDTKNSESYIVLIAEKINTINKKVFEALTEGDVGFLRNIAKYQIKISTINAVENFI